MIARPVADRCRLPDTGAVDRYAGVVRSGGWFQALAPSFQSRLLELARVRRLDAGGRLFARGDAFDGLYCVVEGAVRVTAVSASGEEALLAFVEPAQWFGEIALVDGKARTHDAWAEGATVLLQVPQPALNAMLDQDPAQWREIGRLLSQKLRAAFVYIEETALLPARGRLARRLLSIAEGQGARTDRSRCAIRLSQEQWAQMLALSRQTVNQILKELEAAGAVRLRRGGLDITDLAKLHRFAEPS